MDPPVGVVVRVSGREHVECRGQHQLRANAQWILLLFILL